MIASTSVLAHIGEFWPNGHLLTPLRFRHACRGVGWNVNSKLRQARTDATPKSTNATAETCPKDIQEVLLAVVRMEHRRRNRGRNGHRRSGGYLDNWPFDRYLGLSVFSHRFGSSLPGRYRTWRHRVLDICEIQPAWIDWSNWSDTRLDMIVGDLRRNTRGIIWRLLQPEAT